MQSFDRLTHLQRKAGQRNISHRQKAWLINLVFSVQYFISESIKGSSCSMVLNHLCVTSKSMKAGYCKAPQSKHHLPQFPHQYLLGGCNLENGCLGCHKT